MAKNYIQKGEHIEFTAGAAYSAGVVAVVGLLAGVVLNDVSNGATGVLGIEGVYEVPKATGAITAGAVVYWDADGDPVSGTADTGAATTTSTDNTKMGYAVAAAASGDSTVKVKLER